MFDLIDIPGVQPEWQTAHKIKALKIGGKAPVVDSLLKWKTRAHKEYASIMETLRLAAGYHRVTSQKHVKSSAHYPGVFEAKAYGFRARIFFFYDEENEEIIICTSSYEKGESDQEEAFRKCESLMKWYYSFRQGKKL